MQSSNPVFQVLVTSGNQSLLAAGSRPSALANGQLGIFSRRTGLSIDGTVLSDAQEFFLAVGINRTTGGTDPAEDIQGSAGQYIQTSRVRALIVRGPSPEVPKVVDITNFTALCNTDYSVKIEVRNQAAYGVNGFNPYLNTYSYRTACCANPLACDDCPQAGSAVDLAQGLAALINADPDKQVVASVIAWKIGGTVTAAATGSSNLTVTVGGTLYTVAVTNGDSTTVVAQKIAAQINSQTGSPYSASNTGAVLSIYPNSTKSANTDTIVFSAGSTGVTMGSITAAAKTTITDTTTFASTYPNASAGLRLTGVVAPKPAFNGNIPIKFYKGGADMIVSIVEGLGLCNGTITTVTTPQFPVNRGYEIQLLEYEAGGWNGKPGPYRQSSLLGLQKTNFEYFSVATANYISVVLENDLDSVSGSFTKYQNPEKTYVIIPCADGTTLSSLITVTDLIFANKLDALTDDISGMGCNSTNTITSKTYATDGVAIAY